MPVPLAVACWYPSVVVTSTRPGSTRLAIWAGLSSVLDAAVAFPPGESPCDKATPAPAPAARARTAVAVSPRACLARRRCGGSGTGYCPYGYCANGSLIGPATPSSVAASRLLHLEDRR